MMRTRSTVVVVSLLVALGGCSGGTDDADAPRVASLQSAASASGAATATATSRRPIVPVDATDEDVKALAQPWVACLAEKGGARYRDDEAWRWWSKGADETDPVLKACLPKMPESQQDTLKRADMSAYRDKQREFYRCAKREGYKLTAPDPETGEFGLTTIGPNGDVSSPKWKACEREAFAS